MENIKYVTFKLTQLVWNWIQLASGKANLGWYGLILLQRICSFYLIEGIMLGNIYWLVSHKPIHEEIQWARSDELTYFFFLLFLLCLGLIMSPNFRCDLSPAAELIRYILNIIHVLCWLVIKLNNIIFKKIRYYVN